MPRYSKCYDMTDVQALIAKMIERWQSQSIPISPGVNQSELAVFESRYGVRLPADMREFFTTINGMGDFFDEEYFFRFWPLDQMRSVDEYQADIIAAVPASKGYYVFFDHSIEIFLYAIRLSESAAAPTPVAIVYPGARDFTPSFEAVFDSFTKFIEAYVENPSGLFN